MRAVTYQGTKNIEVKDVKDPEIENREEIIVKITSTAICGSDLHIYQGNMPTRHGFIIGHEPMGIVEEVGPDVTKVKKGDRVVLPFNVSCGHCFYCENDMESQCDNSNHAPHTDAGGLFGYTEQFGNHPGGQAEYLKVPYGNFMPLVIPESCELDDEALLFLSDVIPTAWWSLDNAGMKAGDTVVVLGSGPVGLMTQKLAWVRGAKRVIAVDPEIYRLNRAKLSNNVETVLLKDPVETGKYIREITSGGADIVVDCVGIDGKKSPIEKVEQKLMVQGGTLSAIKVAKEAVRKFGIVQLTGVYPMNYNQFPMGDFFTRNVTLKTGQAPVIHYMPELFQMIVDKKFDPTDIITHRLPLEQAADAYKIFNDHLDDCVKVVLKP